MLSRIFGIAALVLLAGNVLAEDVHIYHVTGQSNATGKGIRAITNPVPDWLKAMNPATSYSAYGYIGRPAQSSDSGIQYQHPKLADSPCFYNSITTGVKELLVDGWGNYSGFTPTKTWRYSTVAVTPPLKFIPSGPPGFVYNADDTHVIDTPAPGEDSRFGPELSLYAKIHAAHPTWKLCFIKCSVGGSGMTDWMPAANPPKFFDLWKTQNAQAVARIIAAGDTPIHEAMIWVHGENGAATVYNAYHPVAGNEYSDQCVTLFNAYRTETGRADLPIIVCRIGNHMLLDNIIDPMVNSSDTKEELLYATNYRRSQMDLIPTKLTGTYVVNMDDLPIDQRDSPQYRYHYTSDGQMAAGERIFTALEGVTPPVAPPPAVVTFTLLENGVSAVLDENCKIEFTKDPNGSLRPILSRGGVPVSPPYELDLHLELGIAP